MVHASRFIVLAVTKVGDSSVVVHTLSPEWGRRSFITGASGKSSFALLQPLSLLEAEVVENPRSDLWRLRALCTDEPLQALRSDIRKNSMTMFMSEVLYRTLREGEGGGALFDWCRHSILTLNALENDFSNYHLRFLLELTGQLGFSAGLEDLAPFAGEYYGVLKELLQRDFASSLLLPLSGEQRSSVAALLLDYIGYHIESQLEIRSLGVLRELFR